MTDLSIPPQSDDPPPDPLNPSSDLPGGLNPFTYILMAEYDQAGAVISSAENAEPVFNTVSEFLSTRKDTYAWCIAPVMDGLDPIGRKYFGARWSTQWRKRTEFILNLWAPVLAAGYEQMLDMLPAVCPVCDGVHTIKPTIVANAVQWAIQCSVCLCEYEPEE
jgi:hypothetical protein